MGVETTRLSITKAEVLSAFFVLFQTGQVFPLAFEVSEPPSRAGGRYQPQNKGERVTECLGQLHIDKAVEADRRHSES